MARGQTSAGYLSTVQQPLLFLGLEPRAVDEVVAGARRRTFQRDEVVFHEGDPGDSMQLVVRGHFGTRATTERGDVCMFRVFGPGDMFGRQALGALQAVRSMTVVSLDESETLEFFRRQLDELRAAHPSVNDALLGMLGMELARTAERLLEALFVDADRRVRRRLLELGEMYRDRETDVKVIPLTQEQIAELAGTSRATVSRVLAEEQRRGTIMKRRRTIAVLDAEELSRWASMPGADRPTATA
jgi:CRP-like cAMP-binding protein